MENAKQQVPIMYSNEKLRTLLEESGLPVEEVFKAYVESLDYEQIPDFRSGMKWFNTTEPLSFRKQLKGKLVLLDFFTYCCINCMHILPDLKEIERTFRVEDGLVVIGVHSAKFDNEKVAENVQNAVERYNIEHPVVNDEGAEMWTKCDIHCWPTLLLIGPDGRPLVMLMGEGHRDTLKLYIQHFLQYFKASISTRSLPIVKSNVSLELKRSSLFFPGKIRAFASMLCISDTGNNRLLFLDDHDNVVHIVGAKQQGFRDGSLSSALFNQPQGVAFLDEDTAFVADTENHAIRRIDFKQRSVSTVAGNGSQGTDQRGGQFGTQQGISSPWDVAIFRTDEGKNVLLVAMAGTHQIWAVFLEDTKWWKGKEYAAGQVVCVAGSGREENRNNSYPNMAAFAQPSGLALCNESKSLFIADSESSSVRKLSLVDGKVTGVVGGDRNPNNLFAFGDNDGASFDAKLQHCIGVAMGNTINNLFVADTYNHKIKLIDTSTNYVRTIKSAQGQFNEPSGLCQMPNGKVYVADTNAHDIKVCTLNEDQTEIVKVDVLHLENVEAISMDHVDQIKREDPVHAFGKVKYSVGRELTVSFHVGLMGELHWNEDAPQKWTAKCDANNVEIMPTSGRQFGEFKFKVRPDKKEMATIDVTFQVFTCLKDLCFNQRFIVRLPIEFCDLKIQKTDEILNVNVTITQDGSVTLK